MAIPCPWTRPPRRRRGLGWSVAPAVRAHTSNLRLRISQNPVAGAAAARQIGEHLPPHLRSITDRDDVPRADGAGLARPLHVRAHRILPNLRVIHERRLDVVLAAAAPVLHDGAVLPLEQLVPDDTAEVRVIVVEVVFDERDRVPACRDVPPVGGGQFGFDLFDHGHEGSPSMRSWGPAARIGPGRPAFVRGAVTPGPRTWRR